MSRPRRSVPRRSSALPTAVLTALSLVVVGAGGASASSASTAAADPSAPTPAVPRDLPARIEAPSPYQKQVSCDPAAKPGAVALGKLLQSTYPGTSYGVARACGVDGIASEHYEGRAVDWMVRASDPTGRARATAFIDWLLAPDAAGNQFANARRLGIMYLIWDDKIWGSYAASSGWRPYSVCASHPEPGWDTGCHRDHVHISLSWAGAMAATSYWTGSVAAPDYGPCRPSDLNWAAPRRAANASPCRAYPAVAAPSGASSTVSALYRYSGAVVDQGSTGPVVKAVQTWLGADADGSFGSKTGKAVSAFRTSHGLAAGSAVDAATWRAMLAAASSGSTPATAGGSTPSAPGTTTTTTTSGSGASPSPLARYKSTVLRPGARGEAVSAVQRALKVSPVSGWYGPVTTAAVQAFQKKHGIPTTGNVGPLTWAALGA